MRPTPTPLMLGPEQGFDGVRFALLHTPKDGVSKGALLYLHPFAEEMNRSRRMAALQARSAAANGWTVLLIDLAGCGDSEGDFGEATWPGWLNDTLSAYRWLTANTGHQPMLWGLRVGALLVAQAAKRLSEEGQPAPSLLLWQPTVDGAQALRQFLRIGQPTEASKLSAALQQGQAVEVAGYTLNPALTEGLVAARLVPPQVTTASPLAARPAVVWMDLSPNGQSVPAHVPALNAWQEAGWAVQHSVISGPGFWTSLETDEAPALLDATAEALQALPASPHNPSSAPTPPSVPAGPTQWRGVAESPLTFPCGGATLQGILAGPADLSESTGVGVVFLVGGPQVRTGAHRLHTILARALAQAGHTTLRFDHRGMGDSTGTRQTFEQLDEDIRAAVGSLRAAQPALGRLVLWGLCDAASAALLYAARHPDHGLGGLVLVNPWVRTAQSLAQAQVAHYYGQRLRSREFWQKLLRGGVGPNRLADWWQAWKQARARHTSLAHAPLSFPDEMHLGWQCFAGPVLLQLALPDLTAQEFVQTAERKWPGWGRKPGLLRMDHPEADHTFSATTQPPILAGEMVRWLEQRYF